MRDLADITTENNVKPINEKAVIQAINNMLNIRTGSLIFNREVGTNLEEILFEPFSFSTKHKLDFIIRNSLMSQVPLAKVKKLDITQNADKRTYEVLLVVDIKGIGITEFNTSLKSRG